MIARRNCKFCCGEVASEWVYNVYKKCAIDGVLCSCCEETYRKCLAMNVQTPRLCSRGVLENEEEKSE